MDRVGRNVLHGGVSTVASYTIFNWVLRYMDPSRVAAVNYVQPVIVILISIPLLGEHPTRTFAGRRGAGFDRRVSRRTFEIICERRHIVWRAIDAVTA